MGRDLVELTFSFQPSIFISSFPKKREQLMCITLSSNVFIERVTILFVLCSGFLAKSHVGSQLSD